MYKRDITKIRSIKHLYPSMKFLERGYYNRKNYRLNDLSPFGVSLKRMSHWYHKKNIQNIYHKQKWIKVLIIINKNYLMIKILFKMPFSVSLKRMKLLKIFHFLSIVKILIIIPGIMFNCLMKRIMKNLKMIKQIGLIYMKLVELIIYLMKIL